MPETSHTVIFHGPSEQMAPQFMQSLQLPNLGVILIPLSLSLSVTDSSASQVLLFLQNLQRGRPGFDPWVGKIPWRRERLPTPVFWLGEFHGLYSPWGRTESDTTE